MLTAAGWEVQDRDRMALFGRPGRGVAVREAHLKTGYADYLLFVDGKALGVVEAKKAGVTLSGVEDQSGKYAAGVQPPMKVWRDDVPLPFRYESTGVETYFTNSLDPEPRSRRVFAFHRPETLAEWAGEAATLRGAAAPDAAAGEREAVAAASRGDRPPGTCRWPTTGRAP